MGTPGEGTRPTARAKPAPCRPGALTGIPIYNTENCHIVLAFPAGAGVRQGYEIQRGFSVGANRLCWLPRASILPKNRIA